MIPDLLGHVAFLDIETTGLSPVYHHVTCIGVYDGVDVQSFVWGQNLGDFPNYITQFPAIATFNGSCFDLPFLQHTLGCVFPHVHFDTRFLLRRLGLRGGLKAVEQAFHLDRGNATGIDGYAAVLLWGKYQATGDPKYLNTLLAYNVEDVVHLESILRYAYNGLVALEALPFEPLVIPDKDLPRPYQVDRAAVRDVVGN